MGFPRFLSALFLLVASNAQALVLVAQPQETIEVGEEIFQPVAEFLSRETGQPWQYRHPDNQLNYVDIILDDRAELYLGDPHFVGFQVDTNRQRILARLPDQEWVLIAPQSSTGRLLGSRVTASFSCTEAPTCALPPPDLGMLLFSNMEVFANNPLRHPILVSVNDASKVVGGVMSKECYCGVTRRALIDNISDSERDQLAVRELRTTAGAAFTVSAKVSPALADRIQAALLSPAGQEATRAMRERLYGGAELLQPSGSDSYIESAQLLIDEFLIPMRRLVRSDTRNKNAVDMTTAESIQEVSSSSGEGVELTVVSWGGAYSASQWKAYHEPYMKQHPGVMITEEESSAEGLKLLREQVGSGNVRWSVVDMTASNAIAACEEGLAMKIPHDEWLAPAPDGTSASRDFGDMIVTPCLVPQIVFSTTFGFRHDLLARAPDSIDDVFNLREFPGARSLEKRPINNLEWALISDGVPADQVYDLLDTPEGVERAFAKLDTIRNQVTWWVKGDVPVKLLTEGAVTIASAYNGRLFAAIVERNEPVSMMWDWQVFDLDGWVVPRGTANLGAVREYLNFATDTQRLADQAKYISYGPARQSSAPLVGQHAELGIDMSPHMPTDPDNSKNVLLFNYEWWAQHQDDLNARFEAWLGT